MLFSEARLNNIMEKNALLKKDVDTTKALKTYLLRQKKLHSFNDWLRNLKKYSITAKDTAFRENGCSSNLYEIYQIK